VLSQVLLADESIRVALFASAAYNEWRALTQASIMPALRRHFVASDAAT
jgi:hypothetical protein